MAGEVLVDALPYIDLGYDDPGVREAAIAMVEEECRRYRPTKNYLEHLPTLNTTAFETELMTAEFERIQNRLPMEPLSMKRYELPPPPTGKMNEVTAWLESVDNSMAQLEHQAVRAMNLELMSEYGCEMWKSYLETLVSMQAKCQTRLAEIKKEIQDVNWARKTKQTQGGEKLRSLEAQWVMLVSKNYEIEQACAKLEERLYQKKLELNALQPSASVRTNEEEHKDD
ncbi:pre-mRNA-splicing factor SPF27-like [Anopheles albimanus]|uniref:Pre-mRNA-splicing factor SPF27 n=1 Tax=Anopheles albimanus TaxID=7167 RepID=A0A182FQ07_ANOAL|nr:pre-mRNA-splicing factor SPF27-like [Anopheles albimanus]